MKRIGIFTLYYRNYNYGGLLQSYALLKVLKTIGCEPAQVSFDWKGQNKGNNIFQNVFKVFKRNTLGSILKKSMHKFCLYINGLMVRRSDKNSIYSCIEARKKVLDSFQNEIPHSKVVNEHNVIDLDNEFDGFVVGSDQVWKPGVYCDAFFLKFSRKRKISYAVSVGNNKLNHYDEKEIVSACRSFDAISLRELEMQDLLEKNGIESKIVLDPTLLLSRDEWNNFLNEYNVDGKYIFCYFLGTSKKHRDIVTQFAKMKMLKIVTLPFLSENICRYDLEFGDIKLYDVSPQQFVGLISKAQYIFTDSFHATIFSGIYNKDFYVFGREDEKTMNGRIIWLLKLFVTEDRLISCFEDIHKAKPYSDIYDNHSLKALIKESFDYLREGCCLDNYESC